MRITVSIGNLSSAMLLSIVIAAALTWWRFEAAPPATNTTFTVLDVGQGDSLLVETRDGLVGLIDTGVGESLLPVLRAELGLSTRLDFVAVTHPDADHAEGVLPLLEHYQVDEIWVADHHLTDENELMKQIYLAAESAGSRVVRFASGDYLDLGCCLRGDVLWPRGDVIVDNVNDASLALLFREGSFELFAAGDLSAEYEEIIVDSHPMDVDALKVSHHGSKSSTSDKFLSVIKPEVSFISAGKSNSYGHPHASVLNSLSLSDVYQTRLGGSTAVTVFEYVYRVCDQRFCKEYAL